MASLVSIDHLSAGYRPGVWAVRDVSCAVGSGEMVLVSGPNGAGKTTFLNGVIGILDRQGTVTVEGNILPAGSPNLALDAGIACVPERRQLFPPLTVRENMLLGAYHLLSRRGLRARHEADVDEQQRWCLELFPRLGDRLSQRAGTLSGGEQQMLAIARALMALPKVLIMDEPTLGLAPLLKEQVVAVSAELMERGLGLIIAEEGLNEFENVATSTVRLDGGSVVNDLQEAV